MFDKPQNIDELKQVIGEMNEDTRDRVIVNFN